MRVKLISEGKEVDKRYVGGRLVWRSDGVIYENETTVIFKFEQGYIVSVGFFKGKPEDIVAFQISDKEIFKLKVEKFKTSSRPRQFYISSNEPGITEYLEMTNNRNSRAFKDLKLYGF